MARAVAACGAIAIGAVTQGQLIDLGGKSKLVETRLVADVERVGPGQTFHVAVVFDVAPKWHIYWKNPGEGAMAPSVKLTTPEGFEVGEIRWPRPKANNTTIGVEYCYEKQAVLFVPVTAPTTLPEGVVTFEARLDWAVCREICKMETATRSLEIATGTPETAADPLLDRHRRRLPKPLSRGTGVALDFDGRRLTLEGPAGSHRLAGFFPDYAPGVTYGEPDVSVREGRFRLVVPVSIDPGNGLDEPMFLGGLVVLGKKPDDPCYDFRIPLSQ